MRLVDGKIFGLQSRAWRWVLLTTLTLAASPQAMATFKSTLEGQHAGNTNWVNGPLTGWQELQVIPMRVLFTGGPATNQVIVVNWDHTKSSGAVLGIEYFISFTPSTDVITLSLPAVLRP